MLQVKIKFKSKLNSFVSKPYLFIDYEIIRVRRQWKLRIKLG